MTFPLTDYLLIVLAIIAHYPFGKKLGVKYFFAGTLVGLCFSGLVAGLLANFCAGLIRPFLLLIIAIGLVLLFLEVKNNLRFQKISLENFKKYRYLYLSLVLAGILLFLFNNPAKVFFEKDSDREILLFNRHYSYYSSQSVEMLNARYFDRLKVANLYPYEWVQYHFFNSGTQAAAQTLVVHPSLLSFWIAQTLISILILLSFAEGFLLLFGFKWTNVVPFAAWIVIGFTIFSDSLTWNLYSTGAFSVFAAVLLVLALFSQKPRQMIIYSVILGVSAFRLLPVAGILVVLLAYLLFKHYTLNKKLNWTNLKLAFKNQISLSLLDLCAIFLALSYNIITLISAKPISGEKITLIAGKFFDNAWLYLLTVYKFIGLAFYGIFGGGNFSSFNNQDFFIKPLIDPLRLKVLALFLLLFIIFIAVAFGKWYWSRRKKVTLWLALLAVIFAVSFRSSLDLLNLMLLATPYFFLTILALYYIGRKHIPQNPYLVPSIIGLYTAGFLLQFVGLDSGIKGPVLYIVFDVVFWGVIGILLFVFADKKPFLYGSICLSIALLFLFSFHLGKMLKMPEPDRHFMKVDVTELAGKKLERSNYVDGKNMANFHFENPDLDDVYACIIGANLSYRPGYQSFINNNFIER